jgi:hypothetical protein
MKMTNPNPRKQSQTFVSRTLSNPFEEADPDGGW